MRKFKREYTNTDYLHKKIDYINSYVIQLDKKYDIHLNRAYRIKSRFDFTPSIRPLYGHFISRYGIRKHPVTKRKRFHKGIDIAAWTGAPIQVSADGVVQYAGWSKTFGYVVLVDHSYGYRTIYAHCSQILVSKNDVVKKGQVIAQVGSTGLSTGPHLHYEIRKWSKSKNPIAYLDVDMFTAKRRLW